MSTTIGVAIPAYGRGRFLAATLESVLGQTRPAAEIVVVDDCSPDNTAEIAMAYVDRGVRYIRNPRNLGVPENYNASLGRLTSDYVFILEDHDLLAPTFIEECAAILDSRPDVVMAFTAIGDIDESGTVKREHRLRYPRIFPGRILSKRLVTRVGAALCLTGVTRRMALQGLEPWYDPKYWAFGDVYLWIRLALRGHVGYVPKPLLLMREREAGHHLEGHEWESLWRVDCIKRDCWSLIFPRPSMGSWWRRKLYSLELVREAVHQMVGDVAGKGRCARDPLPPEVGDLIGPFGQRLVRLASRLRPSQARMLKALYQASLVAPVIGRKRPRFSKTHSMRSAAWRSFF